MTYRETRDGESGRGVYRRSIELASGRFAIHDDGVEFSLVPRRPVMEEHPGRELRGNTADTSVSWDFFKVAWSLFGHSLTPRSPETNKSYDKLLIELVGRGRFRLSLRSQFE